MAMVNNNFLRIESTDKLRKVIYCTSQAVEWHLIYESFGTPMEDVSVKKVRLDKKSKEIHLSISDKEYALRQADLYIKKACREIKLLNSEYHFLEKKIKWESKKESIELCRELFNIICERAIEAPSNIFN